MTCAEHDANAQAAAREMAEIIRAAKEEAWNEGYREGFDDGTDGRSRHMENNPYRGRGR